MTDPSFASLTSQSSFRTPSTRYRLRACQRIFIYLTICMLALPPGLGTNTIHADINWNATMTRDAAMEALRNPQFTSEQYNRFWNVQNPWELLAGGGEALKYPADKGYGGFAEPNAVWLPEGRLEWGEVDHSLPGITFDLNFARMYRSSIETFDGPLGNAWDFSWNKRIHNSATNTYKLYDQGRIDTYTAGTGGVVTSPPGRYDTMQLDTDKIYLTDKYGITQTYYPAPSGGQPWYRLGAISDLHNNYLIIDYDSPVGSNKVVVTNDVGLSVSLEYDSNGRITIVRENITQIGEDLEEYEREWHYTYGSGRLISVRTPIVNEPGSEHDYLSGKTTIYDYDSAGRLVVVDAPGDGLWEWAYDTSGRVTSETLNGHNTTLEYNDTSPHSVVVTDRMGYVVKYLYDGSTHNITKRQVFYDSTNHYDTTWTYNTAHEITSVLFPLGNLIEYGYDGKGNVTGVTFKSSTSDSTPIVWAYEYGAHSRLTSVTDPNDNEWTYAYNSTGDLITKTAPTPTVPSSVTSDNNGNGTADNVLIETFEYDESGNLTVSTDELQNESTFEYEQSPEGVNRWLTRFIHGSQFNGPYFQWMLSRNDLGQFTQVTDPISRTYSYEYNDLDQVLYADEPEGVEVHYFYDLDDDLTRRKVSNDTDLGDAWHQSDMTYDAVGNIVQLIVDIDATSTRLTTSYAYDSNDRLTRLTEPGGIITDYAYNERDLRTKFTRKAAQSTDDAVTESFYDGNANVTKVRDPRHTSQVPIETTLAYDGYSRLVTVTRPEGDYRVLTYDPASNVTSDSTYEGSALLASTTYDYDEANRLYKIERLAQKANLTTNIGDGWQTQEIHLDEQGNVLSVTGEICGCAASTYVYDVIGRMVTMKDALASPYQNTRILSYDDVGNLTKVVSKEKSQATSIEANKDIETSFFYDGRDRLVTLRQKISSTVNADTQYFYGKRDQLTKVLDPEGDIVEIAHNEQLWELQRTIPVGTSATTDDVVIEHEYDVTGRHVTYRAINGDTGDQETVYDYDPLYRLVAMHWPSAPTEDDQTTHSYDKGSNRTSTVDAEGVSLSRTYDKNNRLVQIDVDHPDDIGATQLLYDWDGLDRLVSADSIEGTTFSSVVERTYNTLSLLETEKQVIDGYNGGDGRTLTYAWNIQGKKTGVTYPMPGATVSYSYDDLDRVTAISRGSTQIVAYTFSGPRVIKRQLPGSFTEMRYDGYGRLTQLKHSDGNPLAQFDYAYDKAHQITSQNRHYYDNSANLITAHESDIGDQYGYDEAKRLVTVLRGVATAALGTSIASNAANPSAYDTKVEYFYDQSGNRTDLAINGSVDTSYAYNTVNEMTAIDSAGLTYYDDGGLEYSGNWQYLYDYNDQIAKIVDHTAPLSLKTYVYHYDALGRWVARDASGSGNQVRQYYDGWHTTDRLNFSGGSELALRRYYYGDQLDELVLYEDVQPTIDLQYYAHLDHLGSVSLLVDSSGTIKESYRYSEFGEYRILDGTFALSASSLVKNAVMYTGRFVVGAMGPTTEVWYDLRHRMVLANAGRFVVRDPLGYLGTPQLYTYVNNNPIMEVDPMGLDPAAFGGVKFTWPGTGRPGENAHTGCSACPPSESSNSGAGPVVEAFASGAGAVAISPAGAGALAEPTPIGEVLVGTAAIAKGLWDAANAVSSSGDSDNAEATPNESVKPRLKDMSKPDKEHLRRELKKHGEDPHSVKPKKGKGKWDIYVDKKGDLYLGRKDGTGPAIPLRINIKGN